MVEASFPLEPHRFMTKLRPLLSSAFAIKMTLKLLIKMCYDRSPTFFLGRLERSDSTDLGRGCKESRLMPTCCAPPCFRQPVSQRSKRGHHFPL